MTRTPALAIAAVLLGAIPAFAAEIHVPLSGRTPTAIRADIQKAAQAVCREEVAKGQIDKDDFAACVAASYDVAMQKVAQNGAYVWKASTTR